MNILRENSSETVRPIVSLRDQIRLEEELESDMDRDRLTRKKSSSFNNHDYNNNKTERGRNNPKQRKLQYERLTTMEEIASNQDKNRESHLILCTSSSFSDSDDET